MRERIGVMENPQDSFICHSCLTHAHHAVEEMSTFQEKNGWETQPHGDCSKSWGCSLQGIRTENFSIYSTSRCFVGKVLTWLNYI